MSDRSSIDVATYSSSNDPPGLATQLGWPEGDHRILNATEEQIDRAVEREKMLLGGLGGLEVLEVWRFGRFGGLEVWEVWRFGRFGGLGGLEVWEVWRLGCFGDLEVLEVWRFWRLGGLEAWRF